MNTFFRSLTLWIGGAALLLCGAPPSTAQPNDNPPLCGSADEKGFPDLTNIVTSWANGNHQQTITCPTPGAAGCSDNWGLDFFGPVDGKYSFSLLPADDTVRVYILDTGIAGQHREFGTRVKPGVNITNKILDPHRTNTLDCYGNSHGSHVSGIVAGNVYGAAKRAWLIPVKLAPDNCLNSSRNGASNRTGEFAILDFARAIDWIIANHPQHVPGIVSYSTNPDENPDDDPRYVEAVRRLAERGILLVESAGNNGLDAGPNSFSGAGHPRESVIIVGGIDHNTDRWRRDPADPVCTGPYHDCGSNFGPAVDLWAPAQSIVSVSNVRDPQSPGTWWGNCQLSGTSMAAPQVTGVAATLWARYPGASASAIKAALRQIAFTDMTTARLRCEGLAPDQQAICSSSTNRRLSNVFPSSGVVAGDDRFYTSPGEGITIPRNRLAAGDFSWSNQDVEVVAVGSPQHGTIEDLGLYLKYTPPAGFQGEDSFSYTVEDESGQSAVAYVRVVVESRDRPPVAWNDCIPLTPGMSATITSAQLLDNDWDPDVPGGLGSLPDTHFEISAALDPQYGTLTQIGSGTWSFSPSATFNSGTAVFRYMFTEPDVNRSAEGTVLLKVGGSCPAPLPPSPVAGADSFTTTINTPRPILSSQLLANDSPGAVFVSAGQPQHGTLSISGVAPEGVSYTYTPPAGFTGPDTFLYTIHGAQGVEATGVATVNVLGSTNIVANPDTLSTTAGRSVRFLASELKANDTAGVTFAWAENAQHGTLEIGGVGPEDTIYYFVPDAGFAGTASFEYLISPNGFAPYTRGYVTVQVADAPPSASFTTACDGLACSFNAAGSSDDLGIASRAWTFGDGATGSVAAPSHTYASRGVYLVRLTVTDTGGQTSTTSQVVTADARPVASFTVSCTGAVCSFTSTSTDDGTLTSQAWSFGDGGTGTGATTSHTYGTAGFKTVILTVTDDAGQQDSESKEVGIDLANPVACFTWARDGRRIDLNASCSTDDLGIAAYAWAFGDATTGSGKITSHTYATSGQFTVVLTVTDTKGKQHSVSTPVNPLNRRPTAAADSAVTDRNVAVDINVLANDSDLDNDPLSVSTWTQPAHGTVTKNANGTLRYMPASGYTGPDSFTYRASDGAETSDPATVTLTVRVPNRIPDARDDGWRTFQNAPTNISYASLLANDYDPDGDALTVTSINTAGLTGTLDCSSGTYCRYTPPSWFIGTTSFTYSAADGKGGTDPATVRIKVGVANNLPAPQDDVLEASFNTPLTFTRATLLVNDSDPDGDVLSVNLLSRSALTGFGTVSCSTAYYVCTYTPPAGFTGVDVLTYRATDGVDIADARLRILVRPPSTPVLDARDDSMFFTSTGAFLSYTWMTSNDYDPEGGALTVVSVDTTGLLGTLDCTTYPTGCQYTRGTSDPTRFRYTVRDPQGNLDTATVTLKPGNWAFNRSPVITNDQLSTRTNTPLAFSVFDVLRNDYDPDNDQLNISFYFASTYGRVTCTTPAYFCTYTPNANFTGTDTLTYYANDGNNAVNGTVTMTVQAVTARDAQILSQSVPVSLFAGQSYQASLRIKNVGTQSWSPIGAQCNAFRLGSANPLDNTTFGSSRVELPAAVAPGGEVTLTFTITAPSTPGTYNFQRRMVQECVTWFGDLSPNVVVTVSP